MKKFEEGVDVNKLYEKAVKEVAPYDMVSTSFLQRRFSLPYKDAEKLMVLLEKNKIVGLPEESGFLRIVLKKVSK